MALPQLNAALLASGHKFAAGVKVSPVRALPERVLQFGEGNFLRGFVDWMINAMNDKGLFNGKVVLVQPIPQGLSPQINAQNGLYTLILRGIQGGQKVEDISIISAVSRCLNPYGEYSTYMACADQPELRFIVSNTTEAGIKFSADDKLTDAPPASYPGKLTQFLYRRYQTFKGDVSKGLIMLPCELIERNGDNLQRTVKETAQHWQLPAEFSAWLDKACVFCNTLVDRIVTGYPKAQMAELTARFGYEDQILDTAEIFHFWVIEASKDIKHELPLVEAGLDVVWTTDMSPYRERKVRILNGAHTMTVLGAYLAGQNIVRGCMQDEVIHKYMQNGIFQEIIPTLNLPKDDLTTFAKAVSERFANPYIDHALLDISLNSVSKYKARILGTVKDYYKLNKQYPARLTFALAALIAFYRGSEIRNNALIGTRNGQEYLIRDDLPVLEAFQQAWAGCTGDCKCTPEFCDELVNKILARKDFWGENLVETLPGFAGQVAAQLHAIRNLGVLAAMAKVA